VLRDHVHSAKLIRLLDLNDAPEHLVDIGKG
jgi:hypothetical protein